MNNSTKISIIIPAHNATETIEKCLLSIKGQTYRNFEIIVVDDNSTDNTCAIAQKYSDRVIKNEINLGEGASRNIGAKATIGDILVYTDADVIVPKHWIENIINNMERYNVKCVGSGYRDSVGNSFIEKFAFYELDYRRRKLNGFVNTLVSNNFACTRSVFFELGGFPEKFKCEDLRLSYNISRKYKIFWDKDNGVAHHFRNTFRGYLKQQFNFARDTVGTYLQYPRLIFYKTHQGYSLYLEVIMTFLAIIIFLTTPLYTLIIIMGLLVMNFKFINYLKSKDLALIKSVFMILSRNLISCLGILFGLIYCPVKLLKK